MSYVIEEVIVTVIITLFGKTIQLVIVIVIITKNTLVVGNCNDYSLQVIVAALESPGMLLPAVANNI